MNDDMLRVDRGEVERLRIVVEVPWEVDGRRGHQALLQLGDQACVERDGHRPVLFFGSVSERDGPDLDDAERERRIESPLGGAPNDGREVAFAGGFRHATTVQAVRPTRPRCPRTPNTRMIFVSSRCISFWSGSLCG